MPPPAAILRFRRLRHDESVLRSVLLGSLTPDHFRSFEKLASKMCCSTSHITRGVLMSATSVQFTVAAHIMAALGFRHGEKIPSATLAESVNADPTFVRKSLSKLSKAGLVVTTRGKNGASRLTRLPE